VAAEARQGRLTARPPRRPRSDFTVGLEQLKVDSGTGGLLYVPAGVRPERPAPLVLLLHGAGATAQHGLNLLIGQADDAGPVLLALSSQGETWDLLLGGYGPDVARVDQALTETLQRLPVDPARLAVGGFSDGASYAVSLGLTNGDLFSHVLAFSPGFAAPVRRRGRPRVFVSHGTRDRVLPIDACSRRLVPKLRQAGYYVRYREFDGGHVVPDAVARDAVGWLWSPTA
jgi:phospholipase/carboxylesterase